MASPTPSASSPSALRAQLAAAQQAQRAWAAAGVRARLAVLQEIGRRLRARRAEVDAGLGADGLSRVLQRRYGDWIVSQADPARMARYAEALVQEEAGGGAGELLVRRPDGVVLLVTPGNSPTINASSLFSILLPGNAVVLRAPENDQGLRFIAEEIVGGALEDAGFSRDLVSVVTGRTRPFLAEGLEAPEVRTLVFFGNARVGQQVAERCLAAGKKVVLELEGSDHLVVWRDADVDAAVDSALRAFDFSTQPCPIPKHLLVHGAIFDSFLAALEARLPERGRTIAADPEEGVLAPVAQMDAYFEALGEVRELGELRCGGFRMNHAGVGDDEGRYLPPTLVVLKGGEVLRRSLRLFDEEISFPLIPVVRFDGEDDQIYDEMCALLERSPFGLRASVWSQSPERLAAFTGVISDVGLLVLNGDHAQVPEYASPWGGPGRSGGAAGESHFFWEKTSHLQAVALGAVDEAGKAAVLRALRGEGAGEVGRGERATGEGADGRVGGVGRLGEGEAPLHLRVEGGVGWITLSRPQRHNAVNAALKDALLEATERLEDLGEALRCVVIEGAGPSFCSGADLAGLGQLRPHEARQFMIEATWAFRALERLPVPVIAKVRGYCLGGGLELLLHCDEVYADEGATFGLPEASLGLITTAGAVSRLVADLGRARARELLLSSRRFSADEAHRLGLINHLCPASTLDEAVEARVAHHLKQPPGGLAAVKALIREGSRQGSEAWISEVERFEGLMRAKRGGES